MFAILKEIQKEIRKMSTALNIATAQLLADVATLTATVNKILPLIPSQADVDAVTAQLGTVDQSVQQLNTAAQAALTAATPTQTTVTATAPAAQAAAAVMATVATPAA